MSKALSARKYLELNPGRKGAVNYQPEMVCKCEERILPKCTVRFEITVTWFSDICWSKMKSILTITFSLFTGWMDYGRLNGGGGNTNIFCNYRFEDLFFFFRTNFLFAFCIRFVYILFPPSVCIIVKFCFQTTKFCFQTGQTDRQTQ